VEHFTRGELADLDRALTKARIAENSLSDGGEHEIIIILKDLFIGTLFYTIIAYPCAKGVNYQVEQYDCKKKSLRKKVV
jgi:hypothetical protein